MSSLDEKKKEKKDRSGALDISNEPVWKEKLTF